MTIPDGSTPRIDVHLSPEDLSRALAADVSAGLGATPKELAPKWFYDEVGSKLFDEITRLPEYYPTRRERSILLERADEIVALSRADTLIELGSGTSEKTRILLDALVARTSAGGRSPFGRPEFGRPEFGRFVPFDVSEATLREAAESIAFAYPGIAVHAVVGDFDHHLGVLPGGGRRLIAFLGGTIGNMAPPQRGRFLSDLAASMEPGDALLLGTDLVKDVDRLVAAYDDSAEISASFNRNVLSVINRELNADFVIDRFEHVARFDAENEWMEMSLRSECDQVVTVADIGQVARFADGEEMRTEISAKFRRAGVVDELGAVSLEMARWWTDPAGDFAVSLSFKT